MYCVQMFPATLVQRFCPNFVFIAAQIVARNAVGRKYQGSAETLVGTLQLYATNIGFGFAGIVETHAVPFGAAPVEGYRATLYLRMGLALAALIIGKTSIRMPKDSRKGELQEDIAVELSVKEQNGDSLA